MNRHWIPKILKIVVLATLAIIAFGYLVMSLWNWLLPPLTGWHTIGFGQALALLVLCRILFGGFRGHGGGWHWRHRMQERMDRMSPEARDQLREALAERCRTRPKSEDAAP